MVAVRSAHLNKAGEFDPQKWIASLGISSQQSCERLTETWAYCLRTTQGHPDADLLLWRGVEMVEILSMLNMDIETLQAALLFPLADADVVSEDVLRDSVGKSVVALIHGVRDMAAIRQLKAAHTDSVSSEQVDNVRRMLLAMVDDFRCVVIKLAERIAHLREVKDAPEDERVLAAKECTNIYAPLANRLGIGQLKWELEDYCFRYLHPAEYKRIAKLLHERRIDREHYIEEFVGGLRQAMKEENVRAEVYGRPKHIYSIWRKMQKKHLAFDELFDVRAVRIVAERLQDCYAALGIVHTHFRHLPDEFDDYVANPKPNGYQSIHTVVLGPGGKTVEIQIRTKQMHEDAELGVAAHWKYKEGTSGGARSGHEDRIAWLRKLIAWQEEMADSGEMLDEVRSQVFDDRVYVFTPKGRIVELPMGATAVDFAYAVHSDVGNHCVAAVVEHKPYPLSQALESGQTVEIVTSENAHPSVSWLNFVVTARARTRIRHFLKLLRADDAVQTGKKQLEMALKPHYLSEVSEEKIQAVLNELNLSSLNELFMEIGVGNQMSSVIAHQLMDEAIEIDVDGVSENTQSTLTLSRDGEMKASFAQCCHPIPGDPIVALSTAKKGVVVHHQACSNLTSGNAKDFTAAKWEEAESAVNFDAELHIEMLNEQNVLGSLMTAVATCESNIQSIWTEELENNVLLVIIQVGARDIYHLENIMRKIKQITSVIRLKRNINEA